MDCFRFDDNRGSVEWYRYKGGRGDTWKKDWTKIIDVARDRSDFDKSNIYRFINREE